jgi:hypothetical protein
MPSITGLKLFKGSSKSKRAPDFPQHLYGRVGVSPIG